MTTHRALSDLLAAERAACPPAGVEQRGLVRLVESLAAPVAPPVAAGSAKLAWVGVAKWVVGGALLGVAGSGIATTLSGSSRVGPVERRAAVAASRPPLLRRASSSISPESETAAAPAAPPLASREPPGRASAELPATLAPRTAHRSPVARVSPAPTRRETFDAELGLINAAKGQLDVGRPGAAKVWLDEHAAHYPDGVFATDREALLVLAACAERRDPTRAERFVVRHPTSPFRERLTRACEATNSK